MRWGLLGTGPWATRTHAPALAAHPHAELVGVWGRRPEAAEELAAAHHTRAYGDVDALLADCDAVAVALPPDVQADLAVRAADAGCHLLLDKPTATTVAGARRIVHAAERASVRTVVFLTLRFAPETAHWIAEQAVTGGWLTGRADWYSPVFGGADSPYQASPWRRQKGALWDLGPHALSVLLPALGDVQDGQETALGTTADRGTDEPPHEATDTLAVRATSGPGDTVHLTLRHTSGASSTVNLSHSMPPAAAGVGAELRGPAGVVELPERHTEPDRAFARAMDALMSPEHPHPCDASFALRLTRVLAAAERDLAT